MDWFDILLGQTQDATAGAWATSIDFSGVPIITAHFHNGDKHKCKTICGLHGFNERGDHDRANALLAAHATKMREEIIRLRNILSASEMVNTHSSLDEK